MEDTMARETDMYIIYIYIISEGVCKKVPIEYCRVLTKIRPKRDIFPWARQPHRSNQSQPIVETEGRKGGEEKKATFALLVFILATLEIVFGTEKAT